MRLEPGGMAALLAAVVLVVAACGGSDTTIGADPSEADPSGPRPASGTATTAAPSTTTAAPSTNTPAPSPTPSEEDVFVGSERVSFLLLTVRR